MSTKANPLKQKSVLHKLSASDWEPWRMDELPAGGKPAATPKKAVTGAGTAAKIPSIEQQAADEQDAWDKAYNAGFEAGRKAGYPEGVAEGRSTGHEQGLKEGREEAARELQLQLAEASAPLAQLIANAEQALTQLDEQVADELVELALAVGRQLARDSLDLKPEQVLRVVRELLHSDLVVNGRPRLWLHPEDLALVQSHIKSELAGTDWQLCADESMSRGGCRLVSERGEIDASWESRWKAVRGQLRRRRRKQPAEKSA